MIAGGGSGVAAGVSSGGSILELPGSVEPGRRTSRSDMAPGSFGEGFAGFTVTGFMESDRGGFVFGFELGNVVGSENCGCSVVGAARPRSSMSIVLSRFGVFAGSPADARLGATCPSNVAVRVDPLMVAVGVGVLLLFPAHADKARMTIDRPAKPRSFGSIAGLACMVTFECSTESPRYMAARLCIDFGAPRNRICRRLRDNRKNNSDVYCCRLLLYIGINCGFRRIRAAVRELARTL